MASPSLDSILSLPLPVGRHGKCDGEQRAKDLFQAMIHCAFHRDTRFASPVWALPNVFSSSPAYDRSFARSSLARKAMLRIDLEQGKMLAMKSNAHERFSHKGTKHHFEL